MNPEIMRTAQENLPLVTAAAGYAVGMATDYVMRGRIADRRQPLSEQIEHVLGEQSRPTTWQRMGHSSVSGLAMTGLVAGAMVGFAWSREAPEQPETPNIQIAADLSGATSVRINGESRAIDSTRDVIELFDSSDFDTRVFVASGGSTEALTPEQALERDPFGSAPMSQAVNDAFASLELARSEGDNAPAAIFAITHGNSIGNPATLIERATLSDGSVVPIYIANTEGEAVTEAVSAQFAEIAEETGGAYWLPDEVSLEEIGPIADALRPEDLPEEWRFGLPWRLAALGIGVVGIAGALRRVRQEPINARSSTIAITESEEN